MSLRDRRVQYETAGLERTDLDGDPIAQWNIWYEEASKAGVAEPNAMTVSTIDKHSAPDSRVVLARVVDKNGFVFYTNYDSAKSLQLITNPVASAVFAWLDLHRQVRVRGSVQRVSEHQSDEYFASRNLTTNQSRDQILGADGASCRQQLSFGKADQVACMIDFYTLVKITIRRGVLSVWPRNYF